MPDRFDFFAQPAAYVAALEDLQPQARDCVEHAALAHACATALGATGAEAAAACVSAFAAHLPGRRDGKKGRRVVASIEDALTRAGYGEERRRA